MARSEQLRNKLQTVFSTLDGLNDYIQSYNPSISINQLKARLKILEDAKSEFDDIQTELEQIDKKFKLANHTKTRREFEGKYCDIFAEISDTIDRASSIPIHNTVPAANLNNRHKHNESNEFLNLNLPVLNLKTFSGDYKDWINFENSFKSVIDENRSLNNRQRFQYLKSCLKEEALRAVDPLPLNDQNYREAWKILERRFKNTRLIVQDHVMSIVNIATVNKNSYTSLRELLNTVITNTTSLQMLNIPVDSWDALIVPIIVEKLDYNSKREWQVSLNNEVPTYKEFITFLEKRCAVLESLNFISNNKTSTNSTNPKLNHSANKGKTMSYITTNKKQSSIMCVFCKTANNHQIHQCLEFLKLSISERVTQAKRLKLCENCLRDNHNTSNCRTTSKCRTCGRNHNTLLHSDESTSKNEVNMLTLNNHACNTDTVLLSTAVVLIKNKRNEFETCRALLDPGSMSNYITDATCKRLGLKPVKSNIEIKCLNGTSSTANYKTSLDIKSMYNAYSVNLDCIVVNKITENIPLIAVNSQQLEIPSNIKLADPKFYESDKIDLLIGGGFFWSLLCVGQISTKNGLVFQKTHLGFIAGGPLNLLSPAINSTYCNVTLTTGNSLESQVQRFWELENVGTSSNKIERDSLLEENLSEKYFKETTERSPNGRFIVRLPIKDNTIDVGTSRSQALKRFYNIERKMTRDPEFKEAYVNFIDEYTSLNHMQEVQKLPNENKCLFLPHHAVIKESSTTTKLRVVYDASSKTTNGKSLNDNLICGPTIQDDLFTIIVRFRKFQFALTADITKMYRQIQMHPDDTNWQLILWRENPNDNLKTFRLSTLTYGTKPASFIATRCLKELADQNSLIHPIASEVISHHFYMDDCLTGADTVQDLIIIKNDVTNILNQGQFPLRKFQSNDTRVLENNESLNSTDVQLIKNECTKTLGLFWNPVSDSFKYNVQLNNLPNKITKRTILSTTAQIFDPLGLLGPIIMRAKIILQQLWTLKLNWDESVPSNIHSTWFKFLCELNQLSNIEFPRKVIASFPVQSVELHGFCDSSILGYGAVVYIRILNKHNKFEIRLVCSKSRVAPLKTITLPRLELCGALLLARLTEKVRSSLNISTLREYLWTDSSIALAWINADPNSLQTFVANRVSEINSLTKKSDWRHVRSENNPADILSRGASPQDFLKHDMWVKGPKFLEFHEEMWPVPAVNFGNVEVPERNISLVISSHKNEMPLLTQYSRYNKLQRVLTWVLRFIHNCRNKQNKKTWYLSTQELETSTFSIVKLVQTNAFVAEINCLKNNKELSKHSKILSLNPFLDELGLIRAGGRIKNASVANDVKHPLILPKEHFVTKLIIKQTHENNLHCGAQATLATLRQRFWILSAKSVIRHVIYHCHKCFRVNPNSSTPKMGDLPVSRVRPARPFLITGIDYAGPIFVRESKGRGKRTIKAYIAIFVCFATKAIHIELVSELTTEEFLGAFRRFISRRGLPTDIHSDNATNFVGANNELKELFNFFNNTEIKNKIANEIIAMGIKWHFIPPKSPHMGGLWEINVKSIKQHLKKTVGSANLTVSEMHTLLVRIEACLNSRPITPMTTDPNDLQVLTPGHFLIGEPLTTLPEYDVSDIQLNRLSRWQLMEKIRTHFWRRWSREYLTHLQNRSKWQSDSSKPLTPGAMVLLIEDNIPPLSWKMGRVTETHPGSDGVVRVVTIKTSNGVFKRAVRKVSVLPIENS